MSPTARGAEPRSRAGRGWAITAALAALAAVVVVAALVSTPRTTDSLGGPLSPPPTTSGPTRTGTASPDTSAAPTATSSTPSEAELEASEAVTAVVTLMNAIAADPTASLDGLEQVAAGFVKGEIEALAVERAELGYTQVGSAEVTSVTARDLDLAADPPSVQLDVCIDASEIDVLDAEGDSLAENMYRPATPEVHHYGAQLLDGSWKIVSHAIPDIPIPC